MKKTKLLKKTLLKLGRLARAGTVTLFTLRYVIYVVGITTYPNVTLVGIRCSRRDRYVIYVIYVMNPGADTLCEVRISATTLRRTLHNVTLSSGHYVIYVIHVIYVVGRCAVPKLMHQPMALPWDQYVIYVVYVIYVEHLVTVSRGVATYLGHLMALPRVRNDRRGK